MQVKLMLLFTCLFISQANCMNNNRYMHDMDHMNHMDRMDAMEECGATLSRERCEAIAQQLIASKIKITELEEKVANLQKELEKKKNRLAAPCSEIIIIKQNQPVKNSENQEEKLRKFYIPGVGGYSSY